MSSQNRRFLRVPVGDAQRTAVVHLNARSGLPGALVNESSGGYGLILPSTYAADFVPGQVILLEVDELLMKVRVAHADRQDDQLFVGCERIEEIEDKVVARQEKTSWFTSFRSSAGHSATGQSNLLRDASIALLLAGSLLALVFLPNLLALVQAKSNSRSTYSRSSVSAPRRSRPKPAAEVAETSLSGGEDVANDPAAKPTAPALTTAKEPRQADQLP